MLAGLAPATAQTTAQTTQAAEKWRACVTAKARQFAKSQDPADLVVRVSILACLEDWRSLNEAVVKEGTDFSRRRIALDSYEQSATESTLVRVLEWRTQGK